VAGLSPQAEQAQLDRVRLARNVFDTVADGVLIVRADGSVADINAAAESLFGIAAADGLDVHFTSLLPEFASLLPVERLSEHSRKQRGVDAEARAADGRRIPVHVTISESAGSSGQQYVFVVRDFRTIRWAQQRTLHTERLAAIGETMAALAHESRNALQRMQSCLTLLRLRCDGEAEELLDDMQESQDLLQRLYQEVRNFAAPVQLRLREADLGELLDSTWMQLEMLWRAKGLQWHSERPATFDATVRADPSRLAQVFRNVLENAIHASPDRGVVAVGLTEAEIEQAPAVRIVIADAGPGVPASLRAQAFDLLYTTKQGGTGMGLAIARRIVGEHEGEIHMEASELGGTAVVITLPREPAD
jgi:two-component system, LuxR family, sensor kinase FixL